MLGRSNLSASAAANDLCDCSQHAEFREGRAREVSNVLPARGVVSVADRNTSLTSFLCVRARGCPPFPFIPSRPMENRHMIASSAGISAAVRTARRFLFYSATMSQPSFLLCFPPLAKTTRSCRLAMAQLRNASSREEISDQIYFGNGKP